MNQAASSTNPSTISAPAARLAIAAAASTILLLASLHVLSPEFDPSWRVVSEYANGRYGWVLSLMFVSWAVASWSLVVALWSQLTGIAGRIALGCLIASGFGEAMASVCDINHPLHNLAGMIGVLSLPIAATSIGVRLIRLQAWAAAKPVLLLTASLTWVSLVLLAVALIALMTRHRITPPRIEIIGWTNRFLVVAYCAWVVTVAWQALKLRRRASP
jgi:hypothetical protein